jgi:hypothetical protein
MVELHSNFTFQGSKTSTDGVFPTNHELHETIEITHGFTDWFECGFYIFNAEKNGRGIDWVGDHIRPRVRIPAKWKWPVGLSLSNEIGYQRRQYSVDTWSWEMRRIIDKEIGRWYFPSIPPSTNPSTAFRKGRAASSRPTSKSATTSLKKSPVALNTTVR